VIVVAADDLGQHIEAAGAEYQVDYLIKCGDLLSNLEKAIAGHANAYHTGEREAQFDGICHGHNLHNLIVDEICHALSHACLGDAKVCGNFGKRTPPVLLEGFNNALVYFIYLIFRRVMLVHV
jgi:hypothetical protein